MTKEKYYENLSKAGFVILFLLLEINSSLQAQKIMYPEHAGNQDSVPEYVFDVLRNRPDSVSRFTVCLYPINILTVYDNFEVSIATTLSYDYKPNINFITEFDFGSYSTYYPGNPPVTNKPSYNFSLMCNYYLKAMKNNDSEVTSTYSKPGVILRIKYDGKHISKFGFRGSVNFMNAIVSQFMPFFEPHLVDFIGYDITDPTKKKIDFNTDPSLAYYRNQYYTSYTNMFAGYITVGVEFEKIKDELFKIEGSGKREKSRKHQFYLDLIAAPIISYDNINLVSATSTTYGVTESVTGRVVNVDAYTHKEFLGFRAGWTFTSLRKFGGATNLEIGYFPNIGPYFSVKLGIAYNPSRHWNGGK